MNAHTEKANQLMADAKAIHELCEREGREITAEENEQFNAKVAAAKTEQAKAARYDELEQFKVWEKQSAGRISPVEKVTDLPTSKKHRYSLLKAMDEKLTKGHLTGLEREISDEISHQAGKEPQGFWMPHNVETYVLNETTGTGAIGTQTPENQYIELLRNKVVVKQAGARLLSGLTQNFSIPRQSGGATAYWAAESGSATASNQTLDSVSFTPTTLTCYTDISRRFMKQSSFDAEQFVMDDLTKIAAIALDTAALNGSGSSNQPTGILQVSGIGSVVGGTNGAAPTFANMVQLESAVATANADLGKLAYIGSAKARGFLKLTPKVSSYPQFIYENGEVNSYPFFATNSMPDNLVKGGSGAVCSAIIFGNFDDLIIGMWGGVDVILDPYSGSTSGTVRVVLLQDVQIKTRHPVSFAAMVDALCS
jgi:HK97 family phage major capsid protein